jgi:hypothetical protein
MACWSLRPNRTILNRTCHKSSCQAWLVESNSPERRPRSCVRRSCTDSQRGHVRGQARSRGRTSARDRRGLRVQRQARLQGGILRGGRWRGHHALHDVARSVPGVRSSASLRGTCRAHGCVLCICAQGADAGHGEILATCGRGCPAYAGGGGCAQARSGGSHARGAQTTSAKIPTSHSRSDFSTRQGDP